jgi:hypothetical protein
MEPRLAGKYLCAVRARALSHNCPDGERVVSDMTTLREVECGEGANSLTWTWNRSALDQDAAEKRSIVELWRTLGDAATTLYRVGEVNPASEFFYLGEGATQLNYTDVISDTTLSDPDTPAVPVVTADGRPSAFAHGLPPSFMRIARWYQDRVWYAGDETRSLPNTLYFSEVLKPESVPAENQLTLQNFGRNADAITALIPMDASLYVVQTSNIHRVVVTGHPLDGAISTPVAQRGAFNDRCWDMLDGVAYIADRFGLYAFNGSTADPLSEPITPLWTQTIGRGSDFHFVKIDMLRKLVRVYANDSTQTTPTIALCYSLVTKAWWTERYAHPIGCAAQTPSGPPTMLAGGRNAIYGLDVGDTDAGTPIGFSMKTGSLPLNAEPRRGLRLTYTPTATTQAVNVNFHYNAEGQPRPAAVTVDTGSGFQMTAGSPDYAVDAAASASKLGPSTGHAQVYLAGRQDDKSVGADRDLAVTVKGTLATAPASAGSLTIHRIEIEGVG